MSLKCVIYALTYVCTYVLARLTIILFLRKMQKVVTVAIIITSKILLISKKQMARDQNQISNIASDCERST